MEPGKSTGACGDLLKDVVGCCHVRGEYFEESSYRRSVQGGHRIEREMRKGHGRIGTLKGAAWVIHGSRQRGVADQSHGISTSSDEDRQRV